MIKAFFHAPILWAPILWMILVPLQAGAHDFKVGFLAPLSGQHAALGEASVKGFKLAASERDGHPDEEADGHLGGLDVYLLLVDTNQGRVKTLERITSLILAPGLQFLTGSLPPEWKKDIQALLRQGAAILVDPDRIKGLETRTMDGVPLEQEYVRQMGGAFSPSARMGYSVARLLDQAVREVGDDFSDPEPIRAALARAGYR